MRLTAMGLIAAIAATPIAAGAQPAPAPAAPPPTAPAASPPDIMPAMPMAAPAPEATTPAPAPPPAGTTATPDTAPPAAAPAAAVEPPAPPAPPVLTLPTSGDGAALIAVLENICMPAVTGGDIDAIAKANGYKKKPDGWVSTFGAKPYTIMISPAGSNPTVCNMTIDHVQNGAQAIVDGLNAWAYLHQPSLQLYRNDEAPGADFKRRTVSWEYLAPQGGSTALVFVGLKKPDGTPVSRVGDRSTLFFQVRPPGK